MGCRGQIKIEDSGVFLYTHWGADQMVDDLKCILAMQGVRGRWDDEEYLARIIFSQMVKDDIDGTTGYGIGTSQHGDIEKLIVINVEKQTITVNDLYKQKELMYEGFQEFIDDKQHSDIALDEDFDW